MAQSLRGPKLKGAEGDGFLGPALRADVESGLTDPGFFEELFGRGA
jgi:hypothetical protein